MVAVDAALEHHTVRLTDRTQCQGLHPQIDEGREPVVDLREINVRRSDSRTLPEPAGRLLSDLHDMVQGPMEREPVTHRGPGHVARHVDRSVRKVERPFT